MNITLWSLWFDVLCLPLGWLDDFPSAMYPVTRPLLQGGNIWRCCRSLLWHNFRPGVTLLMTFFSMTERVLSLSALWGIFCASSFLTEWIGRKCPLEWTPCCSEHTCEFVMGAILKARCMQLNPCDLSKLKERICTDCSKVMEMMLLSIREAWNRGLQPRPATEDCNRGQRPRSATEACNRGQQPRSATEACDRCLRPRPATEADRS